MIDRALIADSELHQFRGAFVITDSLTGQAQVPCCVCLGAAFSDLSASRERLLIIFDGALPVGESCITKLCVLQGSLSSPLDEELPYLANGW